MVCNTQSQRMSLNPVSPEKFFESQMRFASVSEKSQLGSLVSWVGHTPWQSHKLSNRQDMVSMNVLMPPFLSSGLTL